VRRLAPSTSLGCRGVLAALKRSRPTTHATATANRPPARLHALGCGSRPPCPSPPARLSRHASLPNIAFTRSLRSDAFHLLTLASLTCHIQTAAPKAHAYVSRPTLSPRQLALTEPSHRELSQLQSRGVVGSLVIHVHVHVQPSAHTNPQSTARRAAGTPPGVRSDGDRRGPHQPTSLLWLRAAVRRVDGADKARERVRDEAAGQI